MIELIVGGVFGLWTLGVAYISYQFGYTAGREDESWDVR